MIEFFFDVPYYPDTVEYKNILLFSGGADSTLIFLENKFDEIIFFDYGQKHYKKEYNLVKPHITKKIKVDPFYVKDKEVNCRNLTFISLIVSQYGDKPLNIWIGTNKEDKYPDNNKTFYRNLENFINKISINRVNIITPLIKMNKSDIVKKLGDTKYFTD